MSENATTIKVEPSSIIEIPLTRKLLNGVFDCVNLDHDLVIANETKEMQQNINNATQTNKKSYEKDGDEEYDEDTGAVFI